LIDKDVTAKRGSPLGAIVMVWAGAGLVFGLGFLARALYRIPLAKLTRDPLATFDGAFYIGAISNIGVLAWAAAATICFFTAALLRGDAALAVWRRFLNYFGVITTILLTDDLFLLHEDVLSWRLHVPEALTYAVYAGLGLAGLVIFRAVIRRTDAVLLYLALAMFGFSVVTDQMPVVYARHVMEDGSKLVGIFAWLAYFARTASALQRHDRGAAAG